MVLYKNKQFITNSDHPNDDWIGDADYVIDDSSELARKIIDYYPKIKLVTDVVKETDDDGNEIEKEIVTDVIKDETYTEKEIAAIREAKRSEISMECEKTIFAGVDFGDDHYSLTTADQANILAQKAEAKAGNCVLYHADRKPCKIYTPEEFLEVATAASVFITKQRTYCNLLMQQLETLTDVDVINSVKYGETQLEGEFLELYQKLASVIQ